MKAHMDTALKQMKEAKADTPIELPVTALGEVAELLQRAQRINMKRRTPNAVRNTAKMLINDRLAQARLLTDIEIGDGQ